MEQNFWDSKLDYLKATRDYFWNDDYFEFLVRQVWKLDKPIKVIDFGCGYGYLGIKLLPLLPQGSSYTGIDMSQELLNHGKEIFAGSPFTVDFVEADLVDFMPAQQYDLAICQAVLRHIPEYKAVLKKMIDAVTDGGRVVCMEVNRRMENAGLYVNGIEHDIGQRDEWLNQKWQKEITGGGRDYLAGAKIPMLMEELGLDDVSVRVNDFAEYISPNHDKENYEAHIKKFMDEHGLDKEQKIENVTALNIRSMIISSGILKVDVKN